MALIKLDGDQIVNYGNDIKKMGTQAQTLLQEVDATIKQIAGGWEGLGSNAFMSQYADLKTKLADLPTIVNGVGSQVVAGGETMLELERRLSQQN